MRTRLFHIVLLVAVTLALFAQTANHRFINYDDPGYITGNPAVRGGVTAAGVAWAFTANVMSNWHPVTLLSHMLDVSLFGLNPGAHHLVSVALHAASALLLYLLLVLVTGMEWRSLAVAALFALHPLHVESVAWAAERKDVLSGLFWHLTLLLYVLYVRKPGTARYLAALACFAVGLMAKPMLVTLPLILLLLDRWPLRRYSEAASSVFPERYRALLPLLREKIPFILLSAVSALVAIFSQHQGGSVVTLDKVPVALRVGNTLLAYVKYLVLTVWPHDLAILYPFPATLPWWQVAGAGGLLAAVSIATVRFRHRYPYLVTGWLWYLIALLPVIGLVQVGSQGLADRYTYLPLTGVFIACCWLIPDLMGGWRHRAAVLGSAAVIIITLFAAATWRQLGYWRDDISLYRHTLAVTTGNFLILNNYGTALEEYGRMEEAIAAYREVLNIRPDNAEAWYNLGHLYLAGLNSPAEAVPYFARAIALRPDYLDARNNLGAAYNALGQYLDTVRLLEPVKAVANRADIHNNLAIAYTFLGNGGDARRELETVRRLDPPMAQRLEEFMNSPRPAGGR